jgi:hypothetical protein
VSREFASIHCARLELLSGLKSGGEANLTVFSRRDRATPDKIGNSGEVCRFARLCLRFASCWT